MDYDHIDIDYIRMQRAELGEDANEIYGNSLATTTRDYINAKQHIKDRVEQHTFFNDNEDRINELEVLLDSKKK